MDILIKRKTKTRGFALIEMLVYIVILSIASVVVVNSMLSLTDSYKNFKVSRNLSSAALTSFERMTREIRVASSITATSTFDTHPGVLGLETGNPTTTIEFYLEGDRLQVSKEGVELGSLIRDEVSVTNLIFRQFATGTSEVIRIEMTLESTVGTTTLTKDFFSSTVLRN